MSAAAARQAGSRLWQLATASNSSSAACGEMLLTSTSSSAISGCCSHTASTSGTTATLGLQLLRRHAATRAYWRPAVPPALKQGFSTTSTTAAQEAASRQRSPFRRLKGLIHDYKKLSKFRLSALVALTASAGYAAGSGESIDYPQLVWTSLGTLGAAACANTLNQLYEIANDGRMTRTAARPLPAGRLSSRHAKVFALLTGAAGLWVLADKVSVGKQWGWLGGVAAAVEVCWL